MAISRIVPPLDYLKEASRSSLQSFELARLNHAANLRREIGALLDQWIKETSEAMLARWMLDQRVAVHEPQPTTPDVFQSLLSVLPDPLTESQSPDTEIVAAPPRFCDSRQVTSRSIHRKPQSARSTAAG
jgi:hypothetical protein